MRGKRRNGEPRVYVNIVVPTNPIVLAYLAGIIDGEGCIQIRKRQTPRGSLSHSLQIHVGNTDERLMNWFMRTIGGYVDCQGSGRRSRGEYVAEYRWLLNGANAAAILRSVLPYLVIKHDQAELAIRFADLGAGLRRSAIKPDWIQHEREDVRDKLMDLHGRRLDS